MNRIFFLISVLIVVISACTNTEEQVNFEKDTTTTTSSISKVNQVSALEFETVIDRLTNLEKEIPERQQRINHIYKNQLYGIAITEITSLLSRRSVYCSKIANGKYSVCLEYHLGNCKGACEGYETEAAYNENIKAIKEILKGNFKDSLSQFKIQMKQCAQNMHFEDAQKIKEKIEILENYQSKSTIVNPKISNVDVFTIMSDESFGYVNFLQLSYGSIIRSHTLEIKKKLYMN